MKNRIQIEDRLGFYPYGAQYHRAPTPLPGEWDGDLREIARAGYTHVQYRPQWRWHERERGRYRWDDLDRLFDLAHKHGMRVVLKPMLEAAPDWVYTELGGKRIGFGGQSIEPIAHGAVYVGGWLPCFDNPGVIRTASAFVERLVRRYHRHPSLWFYDAWNEPRSRPLGQCHCRHSARSYRAWLHKRFGTIENLNRFAGKAWTSFATLAPPESHWDYTELFLWRQWAVWAVAEQVRFVVEAIRRVDRRRMILAHVGISSVLQDAAGDASDDCLNVKHVDRYGTSFMVPLHQKKLLDYAAPDYQSDWVRRIDPRYWCHELYPNEWGWCRPPDVPTLKRLIWMAIAGGAAGITFWQFRAERVGCETNCSGLREIDGAATDRSRAADGIAGIIGKFGAGLAGTRRAPARVALFYNRESDLISRIQSIQNLYLANEEGNGSYPCKDSLKAAHALHLDAGETVDWVVSGDDLGKVELLHVVGAEMIDGKTAGWLRDYVRRGGRLIVEFPFACRDDNTWVSARRPNHGLDDLLGCVEGDRVVFDKDHAESAVFPRGIRLHAGYWKIDLLPRRGKVIARWPDGAAAAVRNNYGRGTVYAFGAAWSPAIAGPAAAAARAIRKWIMAECGLKPPIWGKDQVWVRRREGTNREIWFVFNLSNARRSITLPAAPRCVWQGAGGAVARKRLTLPAGATWVAEMPKCKT